MSFKAIHWQWNLQGTLRSWLQNLESSKPLSDFKVVTSSHFGLEGASRKITSTGWSRPPGFNFFPQHGFLVNLKPGFFTTKNFLGQVKLSGPPSHPVFLFTHDPPASEHCNSLLSATLPSQNQFLAVATPMPAFGLWLHLSHHYQTYPAYLKFSLLGSRVSPVENPSPTFLQQIQGHLLHSSPITHPNQGNLVCSSSSLFHIPHPTPKSFSILSLSSSVLPPGELP
jgi:hypothetical protein